MTRLIYTALMLGLSIFVLSCGKSNEEGNNTAPEEKEDSISPLIGTWILQKSCYDGIWYTGDDVDNETLVITETTLTIFDIKDVMSGKPLEYKYKDGGIWLLGVKWCDVLSLNSTKLKLKLDMEDAILEYKKL